MQDFHIPHRAHNQFARKVTDEVVALVVCADLQCVGMNVAFSNCTQKNLLTKLNPIGRNIHRFLHTRGINVSALHPAQSPQTAQAVSEEYGDPGKV
jgi:hypothetical protein